MPCKKKELNPEIVEKVKNFFQENTDKSYRSWEIAEKIWLGKDEVSQAIKELKKDWIVDGRCAYKIVK